MLTQRASSPVVINRNTPRTLVPRLGYRPDQSYLDRRGGRREYGRGDAARRVRPLCQISNSRRASYGYDQRVGAHGAKDPLGTQAELPTTVKQADGAGYRTDPALPFFLDRYAAAYRAELDAFIAAATAGAEVPADGEDGLRALLLADAAFETLNTGRTVRPPEI